MKIICNIPSTLRATFFAAVAVTVFVSSAALLHAQRLPDTVRPDHYTLSLTPDLKAATFSGVETIDVTLSKSEKHITLNSAEIAFQSVAAIVNGKTINADVSLDKNKEQVTFSFDEKLPAGPAKLSISYTGILNGELRGFYLSKTARRNYAVTQFESTDARRAFPCFDEPAFKATYDVSLTIDAGDTAISNGELIADAPATTSGKHTVTFATTPKMSTYLVAFLVGDFKCSSGSSDGVAIRVCATPDKVALTPYGLGVAEKTLHYYNQYFGIPYPLKKLDLIALPDFEAGAMENFGAITYRETDLLLDEKTATVHDRKEVALVITHEMAHQWFGDLVTMQWWDNLWLNEGFATWMETKAAGVLHPEWNMDQTVAGDLQDTLSLDAQPTTRPIRARADTPDEISQMFDGIAYGKAGAVLSMIENYLGEDTFRQGVHNYLAAHVYGNATAEDFWGAQTANSHKPVDKIMESLVTQRGVPVLAVGDPVNGKVSIEQKRFFLNPGVTVETAQAWTLPVCFKSAASQQCEVLTPSASKLDAPENALLFANAGGKGYYRASYSRRVYESLVTNVETSLTPDERIILLGDQWAQVHANKASVGSDLDLIAAVKADTNAEVIENALKASPEVIRASIPDSGFRAIYVQIAATPAEKARLSTWIRANFAPELAKLSAPTATDSDNTRELRAKLFSILGLYGKDPAVIAQAKQITEKYLADASSVDASLGKSALAIAASNGDAALFNELQNIFETSANPELQEGALHQLQRFEDPTLLDRALNYFVSGKVRNQDVAYLFADALGSDANREQTWKFIEGHWDAVRAQLTTESGSRLVSATGNFCTEERRDEVRKFFASHSVSASSGAQSHSQERINGCIELRGQQEPKLKKWLDAQTKQ